MVAQGRHKACPYKNRFARRAAHVSLIEADALSCVTSPRGIDAMMKAKIQVLLALLTASLLSTGTLAQDKPVKTTPPELRSLSFEGEYRPEPVPYRTRKLLEESKSLTGVARPSATSIPTTGGFSVDVTDRLNSRAFYNSIFLASPGTDEDSFTNTISPCNPGDTSDLFKKAVLLRVNYFREMAGAADDITFNTTYNSKAQRAALIMLANQALNHFPPESWTCYHMDGADAADSSNLSLGNYGWNAISGQMKDNGANNTVAGHRRWIVRPRTLQMGTGDVYNATPATNDFDEAHALWVVPNVGDPVGTSAVRNTPYVAWPPPGYAPFPIVPHRWSFSIAGAGLSAAAVAVTKNGSTVPVTLETVATGYAENTLVFIPEFTGGEEDNTLNTWPQPANDTTYEVTVSGITGAPQSSYTYEVIIIDPGDHDLRSGNPGGGFREFLYLHHYSLRGGLCPAQGQPERLQCNGGRRGRDRQSLRRHRCEL